MTNINVAWSCPECGRIEAPATEKYCPTCATKMQRCSRYEWFLADEIQRQLEQSGRSFLIEEQWPFEDHRGFTWYFDLRVDMFGTKQGGCRAGYLIEVDGRDHAAQKVYGGPGGGYTKDYDKEYEYNEKTPREQWLPLKRVANEDCARRGDAVRYTAAIIVDELCRLADRYS
jgi:hypothetical protein